MTEAVSISKDEYEELMLFKKLVENNLSDDLDDHEIKAIEKAQKSNLLSEKEAMEKYPDFFPAK